MDTVQHGWFEGQASQLPHPVNLFVAQSWLLINRAIRGKRCDPRSLRSLAELCEQVARDEERKAA